MNKCDKCGTMHYRTDPCRERTPQAGKPAPTSRSRTEQSGYASRIEDSVPVVNSEPGSKGLGKPDREVTLQSPAPKPKHIDRHRKGYFQEYHAKRRAAIKAGTWKPKLRGDGK